MFKLDPNGLQIVCDKCRRMICTAKEAGDPLQALEIIVLKPRCHGANGKKMHFCGERCRIVFFKGKKYWKQKQDNRVNNGCVRKK